MKCCNECANRCGTRGTWYDPPEEWCKFLRDEYDMEDNEVLEAMIEEFGIEKLMEDQGVDDPEDLYPECPRFMECYDDDPDPDFLYDMWRDEQMERD